MSKRKLLLALPLMLLSVVMVYYVYATVTYMAAPPTVYFRTGPNYDTACAFLNTKGFISIDPSGTIVRVKMPAAGILTDLSEVLSLVSTYTYDVGVRVTFRATTWNTTLLDTLTLRFWIYNSSDYLVEGWRADVIYDRAAETFVIYVYWYNVTDGQWYETAKYTYDLGTDIELFKFSLPASGYAHIDFVVQMTEKVANLDLSALGGTDLVDFMLFTRVAP